jgi:regulatory protein
MTVLSVKTGADPEVLKVGLSDGSLFYIRTVYLDPPIPLARPGAFPWELTEEQSQDSLFAGECFRAERAALRLIARAEQASFALARKLEQKGYAETTVRMVLKRLEALRLVDDQRFAELWIEDRLLRRAEGPGKLSALLQARGINRRIAEASVRNIVTETVEMDLIRRFIQRNGMNYQSGDFEFRQTLLKSGFSHSAIRRILENEN